MISRSCWLAAGYHRVPALCEACRNPAFIAFAGVEFMAAFISRIPLLEASEPCASYRVIVCANITVIKL